VERRDQAEMTSRSTSHNVKHVALTHCDFNAIVGEDEGSIGGGEL